ncbi:MAG: 3-hydroxypropionyl-coenzyme dehydratase [Blastocatellia bacterium]|nr:3-hydroxypropionyl-coenzyme dehydratase [Blastocatellia bacterium]
MTSDSKAPGTVLTIDERIAVIQLARPSKKNSLSRPLLESLKKNLDSIHKNDSIRALIITGSDDVFSSGADINELRILDTTSALSFARFGQKLFQEISDSALITIAAINGYCLGGGLDLALACSYRFAAPNAVFAHPGANLGNITGFGGTQRLTSLIGVSNSLDLFLTAHRIKADEAESIGLVDSVVSDPVAYARSHLLGLLQHPEQ